MGGSKKQTNYQQHNNTNGGSPKHNNNNGFPHGGNNNNNNNNQVTNNNSALFPNNSPRGGTNNNGNNQNNSSTQLFPSPTRQQQERKNNQQQQQQQHTPRSSSQQHFEPQGPTHQRRSKASVIQRIVRALRNATTPGTAGTTAGALNVVSNADSTNVAAANTTLTNQVLAVNESGEVVPIGVFLSLLKIAMRSITRVQLHSDSATAEVLPWVGRYISDLSTPLRKALSHTCATILVIYGANEEEVTEKKLWRLIVRANKYVGPGFKPNTKSPVKQVYTLLCYTAFALVACVHEDDAFETPSIEPVDLTSQVKFTNELHSLLRALYNSAPLARAGLNGQSGIELQAKKGLQVVANAHNVSTASATADFDHNLAAFIGKVCATSGTGLTIDSILPGYTKKKETGSAASAPILATPPAAVVGNNGSGPAIGSGRDADAELDVGQPGVPTNSRRRQRPSEVDTHQNVISNNTARTADLYGIDIYTPQGIKRSVERLIANTRAEFSHAMPLQQLQPQQQQPLLTTPYNSANPANYTNPSAFSYNNYNQQGGSQGSGSRSRSQTFRSSSRRRSPNPRLPERSQSNAQYNNNGGYNRGNFGGNNGGYKRGRKGRR